MIGFDYCFGGAGAQIELVGEDVRDGGTLAVIVFENFRDEEAFFVDDECDGVRNAPREAVFGSLFVENAERANHFRIGIGQERDGDRFALREVLKHGNAVVADGGDAEYFLF